MQWDEDLYEKLGIPDLSMGLDKTALRTSSHYIILSNNWMI